MLGSPLEYYVDSWNHTSHFGWLMHVFDYYRHVIEHPTHGSHPGDGDLTAWEVVHLKIQIWHVSGTGWLTEYIFHFNLKPCWSQKNDHNPTYVIVGRNIKLFTLSICCPRIVHYILISAAIVYISSIGK